MGNLGFREEGQRGDWLKLGGVDYFPLIPHRIRGGGPRYVCRMERQFMTILPKKKLGAGYVEASIEARPILGSLVREVRRFGVSPKVENADEIKMNRTL